MLVIVKDTGHFFDEGRKEGRECFNGYEFYVYPHNDVEDVFNQQLITPQEYHNEICINCFVEDVLVLKQGGKCPRCYPNK